MQLGTRWTLGAPPANGLPAAVVAAIRDVETEVLSLASESFDPSGWRWTLTWLEGRPVLELDDGTVIRYDAVADAAMVVAPE